MSETGFEASRLKVKRADRHVEDFYAMMKSFFQNEFCEIGVKTDAATGGQVLSIQFIRVLPPEIPLLIGDAVQNLMAAIDYIAYHIVPDERMYFPCAKKQGDLVNSSRDLGLIKNASANIADFIVNDIQPYEGGKYGIWELRDLDRINKHRLLVPTLTISKIRNITIIDEGNNIRTGGSVVVSAGNEVTIPPLWGKIKQYGHGEPTAHILFDEPATLKGRDVLLTLQQGVRMVSAAIATLELLWFGSVAKPNAPPTNS